MKITVSSIPTKSKPQKRNFRPQKIWASGRDLERKMRRNVIQSFDYIGFRLSTESADKVTFSPSVGRDIKDLVFEAKDGMTKWWHAKAWLQKAGFWKD